MTLKTRATAVIATIVIAGAAVLGGLHFFAEHGRFNPAGETPGNMASDRPGRGG